MQDVLDDNVIPHERRHGSMLYKSPGSGSIAQIRTTVIELLHKEGEVDAQIPSEEWTRLQFTPANIWCNTAIKYTLRFDIHYGLQTRLTRKHHPDHKYGTVLFIYFKEFAVKFRIHISLFFLDDKCSIPIGDYDSPVSVARRQRKTLGGKSSDACDHDHIPLHITPSVINIFDTPPRLLEDGFFRGKTTVFLKDAVF